MSISRPPKPGELVGIVERAEAGDAGAQDVLFATLYSELHQLAERHLRRSGELTLGATTLLHEAYLELNGRTSAVFPDRLRFLKYASRAMRGLIIDYVRAKRAHKRGGEITFVDTLVEDAAIADPAEATSLETLGRALDELARLEPTLAEVVDLKFFCGFSFTEIATLRGVSERTVQRDWAKARLLLRCAMSDSASPFRSSPMSSST